MRPLLLLVALAWSPLAVATTYYFDEAPFTVRADFDPFPLTSRTDEGHTVKQLQASQFIRFWSNDATIQIRTYFSTAAARTYVLLQNGVQVGSVDLPATGSGAYDDFTLASGLSTSAVYEYRILCTTIRPELGSWYDMAIILTGGDGLAAVGRQPIIKAAGYGDSITAYTSAHQTDISSPIITDTRYTDLYYATSITGRMMYVSGVAGGAVNPTGRDSTANIPTNCDEVHVRYGTNDLTTLPGASATFQQAYTDMITNIRTRIGAGKPIYCYQPIPRSEPEASQRALCGTLMQAAIAGMSAVYYFNTDGWVTVSDPFLPDGLHPNAAGYVQYGQREIALWAKSPSVQPGSSGVMPGL